MLLLFTTLVVLTSTIAEKRRLLGCPAEGYFILRNSFVDGVNLVGGFELDEVEDGELCSAKCYANERCGYFQVYPTLTNGIRVHKCDMFGGELDESMVIETFPSFVGIPCAPCPAKKYLIYANRAYVFSSSETDSVFTTHDELKSGEGGDRCNAMCISSSECGVFEVQQLKTCRNYFTVFNEGYLVKSPGDIVGVPCLQAWSPTESPMEPSTKAGPKSPTSCSKEGYLIHPYLDVGVSSFDSLIVESEGDGARCFLECTQRFCHYFEVRQSTHVSLCLFFDQPFDKFHGLDNLNSYVGVPC